MDKYEIMSFIRKQLTVSEIEAVGNVFRTHWEYGYGTPESCQKELFLALGSKVSNVVPYSAAKEIGIALQDLFGQDADIEVNIVGVTHRPRFVREEWDRQDRVLYLSSNSSSPALIQ